MPSFDVIVIGAGVNGLACASHLARQSRRVLLLEAGQPGGGMALAHLVPGLDPRVAQGMDLARHGLTFHPALATTVLHPEGRHRTVSAGHCDGPDTAAYAALHRRLTAFARVLTPFRQMTPPRLTAAGSEWGRLARLGLGIRALGKTEFRELLRMILINVADVAEDELSDDLVRGLLAFDATLGSWLGPRSPNSLILLLNRLSMGASPLLPKGGLPALAGAMTRAALSCGVTIREDARVAQVVVEADRASGVTLTTGEHLYAPLIVSAISPKTTLLSLVGPRHLDAGFTTRLSHVRSRGGAAKLHLTLRTLPDFRGADLRSRLVIAPSVTAVEAAFNPVKYGEVPDAPVMEIVLPSAHDPGPPVLSAIVQFAPHSPKAGLDTARAQMLANTLRQLETCAPGLGALTTGARLLMPQDIEAEFGMVGGNWHHGELSVEQMLFLRPLQEAAQYQTPLPGLWLAGAGSHPGGGITGAAGWNAAERIVKERA